MDAPDRSATEHDRLREAISDIREDGKDTRAAVSKIGDSMRDLREVVIGWKGDVELRLAGFFARLKILEDEHAEHKKNRTDRANLVLNTVLIVLVGWVLYRTTGIKAP